MAIHDDNGAGLSEEAAEAALLATLSPGDDDGADHDLDDTEDLDGDDDTYEDYEPNEEDLDGDEAPEGDEDDSDDADEPGDPDEDPKDPEALSDDAEVVLTIGGEARKFTAAQLKGFAEQEGELKRATEEVDLVGARASAALQAAIEVVGEDLQPYTSVDWLVLQQQLDPETFAWHRQNAQRLDEKYRKLLGAAQGVEKTFQERRTNVDRSAASAALKELKTDVPDWSDAHYQEILKYGESQGLDPQDLNSVTNAKVIKLIRKAMLHDKGQKVATKKVKQAPTKVLKTTKTGGTAPKQVNAAKAMKRLAQTGSDDAAVAALLGRWG